MQVIVLVFILFCMPFGADSEPNLCTASVINLFPENNFAYSIAFYYSGPATLDDVQFLIQPTGFYRLTYVTDTGQQSTLIPDSGAAITLEPNTHATLYYEGGIARPAESLILQSGEHQIECDLTHTYFEKVRLWFLDFFRLYLFKMAG